MDDYLETITLLQEEVARLEQELQMRDESRRQTTSNDEAAFQDEAEAVGARENLAGKAEEVERIKAELASRDETISLLLDEVSRVEEAQAATRAEWEHLAEWVAALEQRVEGQDGDALHQVENRLAAQEQKADALKAESVDARLAETLNERQQLRRQLEQVEDERKRERLEYEATVAELQARLAQAALIQPQAPRPDKKPEGISPELDIELRVRALRHHFQEVHEHEKEERRQKQLISRLSRLWRRTGPR
jgi:uncharacterized small protein (DUF1192 family)